MTIKYKNNFILFTLITVILFVGLTVSNMVFAESESSTITTRSQIIVDVPALFDDDYFQSWQELDNLLRNAKDTDFILRISGLGGNIFLVNDFNRAMEDSQKAGNTVSMDVIGVAASGHAYMTCGADKVTIRPGASLLFHQVYGIASLFFGYIQLRELSTDSIINNMTDGMMQTCLRNGRLTEKDIEVIKSGDDVILLSQSGKIIKQYEHDDMTVLGFTLPLLFTYLSNLMAVLLILGSILYVFRKAGK